MPPNRLADLAQGPLDGVRVLELTRVGPAAFCTRLLGDMGAEVIKVEEPNVVVSTQLALSTTANRNKKSVTLDLKNPKSLAVFKVLAATTDVLVEGFRPGVMRRLGADCDTLLAINPRLVYCSMSGFGQDGPYSARPGHDINYLAMSGLLSLIGERDRPPAIPLNVVADLGGAAMNAVAGVLLALIARERTGRGQFVDISYLDASFSFLSGVRYLRDYLAGGDEPRRGRGIFSGRFPFYGVYRTADKRDLTIGCVEPRLWQNFCAAIGRSDLVAAGPRDEELSREPRADQLHARDEVAAIMLGRTAADWERLLTAADVPCATVSEVVEALDNPQLRARGMITELFDNEGRAHPQIGAGIRLADTPGSVRTLPPLPGQDNFDVFSRLGLSAEDIDALGVPPGREV